MTSPPRWDCVPEDKFCILYSFFHEPSSSTPSPDENQEASNNSLKCAPPVIRLAYNTFGNSLDPCLLLIQDAGCPGVYWHEDFCDSLAKEGHLFVVRYDQRDTGRSTFCTSSLSSDISEVEHPTSSSSYSLSYLRKASDRMFSRPKEFVKSVMRGVASPTYTLTNLAQDALELLNKLGIRKAHFVGLGLGAAVVQYVLASSPTRVLSAALISPYPHHSMHTINVRKGYSSMHSLSRIFRSPAISGKPDTAPGKREGMSAHSFAKREVEEYWKFHYGCSYDFPEEQVYERVLWSYDRHPPAEGGVERQVAALLSAPTGWPHTLSRLNPCCDKLANGHRTTTSSSLRWSTTVIPTDILWSTLHTLLVGGGAAFLPKAIASCPLSEQSHIPIVLICGSQSKVMHLNDVATVAHLIPGSSLIVYPKMGHVLPTQLFSDVVKDILYNCEGKGSACAKRV